MTSALAGAAPAPATSGLPMVRNETARRAETSSPWPRLAVRVWTPASTRRVPCASTVESRAAGTGSSTVRLCSQHTAVPCAVRRGRRAVRRTGCTRNGSAMCDGQHATGNMRCATKDNMQRAACSVQRVTRNTQRATCNAQHGKDNMQHTTCNMQHATCEAQRAMWKTQHATCDRRHATCDRRHATCDRQHATCDRQHEACNMQHATC